MNINGTAPGTRRNLAEGFQEDALDFLKHFREEGRYTLPDFMKLWRDKRMSLLYMGRTSEEELYQFTQTCFAIVITILRYEASELPIKAGALYFLYCLYGSQPLKKYPIRITLDDYKLICDLLEIARKEKLYTLALAIVKLGYESAFQFVGCNTLMGPGIPNPPLEEYNMLPIMLNPKGGKACKDLSEAMQKFIGLSKMYQEMKKELGYPNPDAPNVDGTLEEVAKDDDDNTSECITDIGARRRQLKMQQMGADLNVNSPPTEDSDNELWVPSGVASCSTGRPKGRAKSNARRQKKKEKRAEKQQMEKLSEHEENEEVSDNPTAP